MYAKCAVSQARNRTQQKVKAMQTDFTPNRYHTRDLKDVPGDDYPIQTRVSEDNQLIYQLYTIILHF